MEIDANKSRFLTMILKMMKFMDQSTPFNDTLHVVNDIEQRNTHGRLTVCYLAFKFLYLIMTTAALLFVSFVMGCAVAGVIIQTGFIVYFNTILSQSSFDIISFIQLKPHGMAFELIEYSPLNIGNFIIMMSVFLTIAIHWAGIAITGGFAVIFLVKFLINTFSKSYQLFTTKSSTENQKLSFFSKVYQKICKKIYIKNL